MKNKLTGLSEAARKLGISKQLLAAHAKKPGAPPLDDTEAWEHFLAASSRGEAGGSASVREKIAEQRLLLLTAMRQREEIRLEKDKGKALDKDEVAFAIGKTISALVSELDRLANIELPPAVKGLDERAAQVLILEKFEEVKARFKAGLEAIKT